MQISLTKTLLGYFGGSRYVVLCLLVQIHRYWKLGCIMVQQMERNILLLKDLTKIWFHGTLAILLVLDSVFMSISDFNQDISKWNTSSEHEILHLHC